MGAITGRMRSTTRSQASVSALWTEAPPPLPTRRGRALLTPGIGAGHDRCRNTRRVPTASRTRTRRLSRRTARCPSPRWAGGPVGRGVRQPLSRPARLGRDPAGQRLRAMRPDLSRLVPLGMPSPTRADRRGKSPGAGATVRVARGRSRSGDRSPPAENSQRSWWWAYTGPVGRRGSAEQEQGRDRGHHHGDQAVEYLPCGRPGQ